MGQCLGKMACLTLAFSILLALTESTVCAEHLNRILLSVAQVCSIRNFAKTLRFFFDWTLCTSLPWFWTYAVLLGLCLTSIWTSRSRLSFTYTQPCTFSWRHIRFFEDSHAGSYRRHCNRGSHFLWSTNAWLSRGCALQASVVLYLQMDLVRRKGTRASATMIFLSYSQVVFSFIRCLHHGWHTLALKLSLRSVLFQLHLMAFYWTHFWYC